MGRDIQVSVPSGRSVPIADMAAAPLRTPKRGYKNEAESVHDAQNDATVILPSRPNWRLRPGFHYAQ